MPIKDYMLNKYCDVMKIKEYYMRQEQLFYTIGKDDELLKGTFILNMPTLVAKLVEAKIKAKNYNISRASLVNIHAIVETILQEHYYM